MSQQYLRYRLTGVSPLLMHNGQTADPANRFSKLLKPLLNKRSKTEEDFLAIADLEWPAGLYVNAAQRLILPADILEAALVEGAKKSKLGKQFRSSVFVYDDPELQIPTVYKVATDLQSDPQYRDVRAVQVNGRRIMRCRPIFREWSAEVVVAYQSDQVEAAPIRQALRDAGRLVGVGDYRPRYGRFDVEDVA